MKKEINYSLEALRVMACVMVICIHVSNYYCRGYGLGEVSNTSYVISVIWNSVSRVAVPIFFMISGSLLLNEPIHIKKSVKRVGRTLLTLLLWSGIYYVWNWFYRNRIYDVSIFLEEPVKKHLWFLYAMIGIYAVTPFLQSMVQNMSDEIMACFVTMWVGLLTVGYIFSIMGVNMTYKVPLLGESCYVGYFIMGYLIKVRNEKIPMDIRTCFGGMVLAVFSVVVLTCICTELEGVHVDKLFENRNIIIAIAAMLLFSGMLQCDIYSERVRFTLRFLSQHTFMIYLCHVIFVDIVKLEFMPRLTHAAIGIPIYTTFVFGASLLFSVGWKLVRKNLSLGNKVIDGR